MPEFNRKASKTKVFMYEAELNYLKWLVVQKPNIETGGDLFGLWQNKHTSIVQLILGPGKGCSRTNTSFHQDVDYLGDVGRYLTSSQGLCNIGEWHSHHRIGLTEPSGGDTRTVWDNMPEIAGGRFLLFIAHIEGPESHPKVNVRCFVFDSATGKMTVGKIESLPSCSYSPLRDVMNEKYLKPRSELAQDWETFLENPYDEPPRMSTGKKQGYFQDSDDEDDSQYSNETDDHRPMLGRTTDDEEANMGSCCTCARTTEEILRKFWKSIAGVTFIFLVIVIVIVLVYLFLHKLN